MQYQTFEWSIIDDNKVRHRWECPECNNHVYVKPWYYSEMDIPICTECEWDDVMEYIRTEISV
jgi:NAD-dependent SIR2 family protein deacetylase